MIDVVVVGFALPALQIVEGKQLRQQRKRDSLPDGLASHLALKRIYAALRYRAVCHILRRRISQAPHDLSAFRHALWVEIKKLPDLQDIAIPGLIDDLRNSVGDLRYRAAFALTVSPNDLVRGTEALIDGRDCLRGIHTLLKLSATASNAARICGARLTSRTSSSFSSCRMTCSRRSWSFSNSNISLRAPSPIGTQMIPSRLKLRRAKRPHTCDITPGWLRTVSRSTAPSRSAACASLFCNSGALIEPHLQSCRD